MVSPYYFRTEKKTTHTQKSVTSSIKSNSFGALIHLNFVFVIHEKKERIRTLKKATKIKQTHTPKKRSTYSLCATFRITLCAANTKNIYCAAASTEKASTNIYFCYVTIIFENEGKKQQHVVFSLNFQLDKFSLSKTKTTTTSYRS